MKVALTALCVNPKQKTGLATMFGAFVREALRLDQEVEFVVFAGEGVDLGVANSRVTIVDCYPAADRPIERLYADYLRVAPAAKRAGCDVLMTNALVPVRSPLPVAMHLLSMHHLGAHRNGLGGARMLYRSWATRYGLAHADLIITNTKFACDQILASAPSVAPKLLQSYEGIDHNVFHANKDQQEREFLARKFGIEGEYCFWCSNFYPYKNAELLMTAWCELPRDQRARFPLVMVGGGNWGGSQSRALDIARARGAAGEVKILGWVEDDVIPVLFRHARVFVHPSSEETFGRSVLEAMASGVPCVVQNIPVMREIAGNGSLLIDYQNVRGTVEALERALFDDELRARLVAAGLTRAKQFSFTRLASERLAALRDLLGITNLDASSYPAIYATSFRG